MEVNYISLSDYFNSTQKYYYFFDGLFNNLEESKRDILDSLNIPDSTYRTNRQKIVAKNNNHHILTKYFNYSTLDLNNQKAYENTLSRILNYIYFRKTDKIIESRKLLEEYIKDNNYLKPIFTVIKILIDIRDNCCITNNYVSKQANRLNDYIKDKYNKINKKR